jgi:hypothetical protein
MTTDTSRTLVIENSPARLLRLVGMGVVMTAVSVAVALMPGAAIGIWGYLGIAFFGLCTVVILWHLLFSSGPVITISPEGIRDTRVAAALIPWSAVTGISTWEYSGQKAMVLAMKPGAEAGLGLTRMARWTRGANRALGADGLCITAAGLKIDYDALLRTSLDYAHAGRDRSARDPATSPGAGVAPPTRRDSP